MIERVEFRNFKALREVSLDLERLTVLVGPNASGKTSVLEGIYYLLLTPSRKPQKVFESPEIARHFVSTHARGETILFCSIGPGWLQFAINPDVSFPRPSNCSSELVEVGKGEEQIVFEKFAGNDAMRGQDAVGRAVLLRLDTKSLGLPSYSSDPIPQLQPDGEGLASVLAYMHSNEPETFERLQDSLRMVVPVFRSMRFPRAPVVRNESEVITVEGKTFTRQAERQFWGNSIEFDMVGGSRIPASMVSEGTMLVLGLLTALMSREHPQVILLDDIDRALHPKAQAELVDLLRKLLDQNPDMQIVATSHSPYLLDHLRPEEVRLTTLRDDGSAVCGRLDQHPDFDRWKESMTPGEFWSLVGENWLVAAKSEEPQP